jgi:hypothetical protein
MKTCTNISTMTWPAPLVEKAIGHSLYHSGYATSGYSFSRSQSLASVGKRTEGNMNDRGVSR